MRISEIQQREDFVNVLSQTLETGWSTQYGRNIQVSTERRNGAQPFALQPLLSALFVENPSANIRKFLADSFRYTNVTWRILPQFVLGSALSSSAGLKMFSHTRLWVHPALPNSHSLLILPGNQRVRILDFQTGISRVFLKAGYSTKPMKTEISIRAGKQSGPFPPITAHCTNGKWFEEPIIHGFNLARTPPWKPRKKYEVEAMNILESWSRKSAKQVSSNKYISELNATLKSQLKALNDMFPNGSICWDDTVETLCQCATGIHRLTLVRSHGDFQAGNILIEENTNRVLIIDWEYAAMRSQLYDKAVYEMRLRSTRGLAERMSSKSFDRPHMAIVLLEEMSRLLSENLSGNYVSPTLSLRWLEHELSTVITQFE